MSGKNTDNDSNKKVAVNLRRDQFPVAFDSLAGFSTIKGFLSNMAREKPIAYSAKQIAEFTHNHSCYNILGLGGFGAVYKGLLQNGVQGAVKVLTNNNRAKIVEEQFMAEVGALGRSYHVNLVRLYGFFFAPEMKALVYEYMENGSLDKLLFNDNGEVDLEKLHVIAVQTAKGFGILLFEIVGRRRHYDDNVSESRDWLPKWTWNMFEKNNLAALLLCCGIEERDRGKAERMLLIALWCIQHSPEARPLMSNLVQMLEGRKEITPPPCPFEHLQSSQRNFSQNSGTDDDNSTCSSGTLTDPRPFLSAAHEIELVIVE
ncbi:putative protein kinase RLK-Pelle-RLCK-Os family [Rosa chinensis]|uniref:Protein kinase domain-containing protein n=1 Tax=Rosa chinensis TaxID=74649 RepID=A0A2P6SAF1_ROSCH|nr:putative protein kinase RLK-Pelle-RLCK-Os family [Rosa chinensis]